MTKAKSDKTEPAPAAKPRTAPYIVPFFQQTRGWLIFDVLTFLVTPAYVAAVAGPGRQVRTPLVPLGEGTHPLWLVVLVLGVVLYLARELVDVAGERLDQRRRAKATA